MTTRVARIPAHAKIQTRDDNISREVSKEARSSQASVKRPCLTPYDSDPPHEKTTFPFLSLPGELRNRIYEHCFPPSQSVPNKPHVKSISIRYKNSTNFQKTPAYLSASHKNPRYINDDNRIKQELREAERFGHGDLATHCFCFFMRRGSCPHASRIRKPTAVAILAVCSQIYEEAAPMLYSRHLVFEDVDALINFASSLSSRTAKLVRHVEVKTWYSCRDSKRLRLRGQTAMAILAEKSVTELETLKLGDQEVGAGSGQVLRRSSRRR